MPTDELTALDQEDLGEDLEFSESRPPRSGLAAGVAVLFALGALAVSGLVWWEGRDTSGQSESDVQSQLQQLQQNQTLQSRSLSDLSARLDGVTSDTNDESVSQLESGMSEQLSQIRELQGSLETQQSYTQSLQQAIDSLQARLKVAETGLAAKPQSLANAPSQLDIATVEYLLRLAPERLALFHDLGAADQALAHADAQLAAMDNPIYIGLRQHIADARQTLAGTELPNSIEISARLDDIQHQLASLTFGGEAGAAKQSRESETGAVEAEKGWWQRLKESLSSLVTVRRSAADSSQRLTLEDKDMLRQGLWMQVEGARLALMRHDQESWQDTLSRADDALSRWFDPSTEEFTSVKDELSALSGLSISPELPDISGPWAQLQLIRQAGSSPVAPVTEPHPAPAQDSPPENGEVITGELTAEPASEPEPEFEPGQVDDSG
jgi:uncharacterized protein HemX